MPSSTSTIFPEGDASSSHPCRESVSEDHTPYQLEWEILLMDTSELVEGLDWTVVSESWRGPLKTLFEKLARNIYDKAVESAEKISMLTITKMNTYFNDVLV